MSRTLRVSIILCFFMLPASAWAQIAFEKTGYYVALGDSVAAGEGALPVTRGYVYQLYDRGVFGKKQEREFANIALRGARSWDLRDHQVPQVLCATPRPSVVTITAGANDFFGGDINVPAIASRVVESINILLNNGTPLVATPVLNPVTGQPCPPLSNVILWPTRARCRSAPSGR